MIEVGVEESGAVLLCVFDLGVVENVDDEPAVGGSGEVELRHAGGLFGEGAGEPLGERSNAGPASVEQGAVDVEEDEGVGGRHSGGEDLNFDLNLKLRLELGSSGSGEFKFEFEFEPSFGSGR